MEHAEKILEIDPNLISTLTCELKTPLWLAVERGHDELIKKLFLRYPQAVHMTHERGQSPFLLAVQLQNHQLMNMFFPEMTLRNLCVGIGVFLAFLKIVTLVCNPQSMCNVKVLLRSWDQHSWTPCTCILDSALVCHTLVIMRHSSEP